MWTPEYFVRYTEFPAKVEGVTIPNNDGTFDIYINAIFCESKKAAILAHELRHIKENHFYNDIAAIRVIENAAKGIEEKPERLPDVFFGLPEGTIACFHSLEHMKSYIDKFIAQRRADREALAQKTAAN